MENSKTVAQTLLGETAQFCFCPPPIAFLGGLGGVPEISFSFESLYFCYLGVHAKFQNCSTNPSWRNGPFRLFPAQNRLFGGSRGGPRSLIFVGILLFLLLRSPCKISKLLDKPFWEKQPISAFVRPKSAFLGGSGGSPKFFSSLECS